jgi:hypothetical protein
MARLSRPEKDTGKTMKFKNLLFALLVLALPEFILALGTPAKPSLLNLGNNGSVLPILRDGLDSGRSGRYLIHLDTMEVDTGVVLLNILGRPIKSYTDTIGTLSISFRDSNGTDTNSIVLKWQGNALPKGDGAWVNMDSITCTVPTSNASGNWITRRGLVVVDSAKYTAIRFFARNALGSSVGRKASIKDAVLISRPLTNFFKNED